MTPLVTPASSVVVPAVDAVDNHRSIPMTPPRLPVAVAEPLDSHHSGRVTLHHHSAHRAAVAGVSVAYCYAPGNWSAANHDFC